MNRKTLLKVKLGLLTALGVYVIAFIVVNSMHTAEVWLFPWVSPELSIAVVIGVTMGITLLLAWFGRQLMRTIRELRRKEKPDAAQSTTVASEDQG